MKKCRALNRNGKQCSLNAVIDGFCIMHFNVRDELVKKDRVIFPGDKKRCEIERYL